MAVGKRQVATLIVPVGGQIPPLIGKRRTGPGNAKQRIEDAVFMHVNENKNLVGRRFGNFCESPEAGKVVNAGMRAVRNTIDRFVHVVAASSKHRQFLSAERRSEER